MCHDLSYACTPIMRHCQRSWYTASLMRDTGGWITLRHAAIVFKQLADQKGRLGSGGKRGEYPLISSAQEATHDQVEWWLAAFGCVAITAHKHRVQLLIEKGVRANTDQDSPCRVPNPFIRPYAIRFAYGHSVTNQDFLMSWRCGAGMSREMLRMIPGFFHYTLKLAAMMTLKGGVK